MLTTDLRATGALTLKQLTTEDSPLLCNVALPFHILEAGIDPDRDCDRIAQVLSDRHKIPLETAQRMVEAARQKTWD